MAHPVAVPQAQLMEELTEPPIMRNTWGDAIYAVSILLVDTVINTILLVLISMYIITVFLFFACLHLLS
jgi:hypothetical protein